MTKTHDFSTFADDLIAIIRDGAASSELGRTSRTTRTNDPKPMWGRDNSGTTCGDHAVRLAVTRTDPRAQTRTAKGASNQGDMRHGTTGTSGTTNFTGDEDQNEQGGSPAEWHAILAELEQRSCPDWLAPDRWEAVLSDAENFLSRWGAAAHALGWTALDLFGVHPTVPAARFDVMGLIPILHGGEVVALTERAATIRRSSNAVLAYRRPDQTDAVCITQVAP